MQNIVLPHIPSLIESQINFDSLENGLMLVVHQDSGWIDSVVLSIIELITSRDVETHLLMNDSKERDFYGEYLQFLDSDTKMEFYGNLSRDGNLENALARAENHLTLGYFHLNRREDVLKRIADILGREDFDQSVIKYVFSQAE